MVITVNAEVDAMKEISLAPNYDAVAPVDTEIVLVSHSFERFYSSKADSSDYFGVVGVTPEGQRLLLSGSVVYQAFKRLEAKGYRSPYATPMHLKLTRRVSSFSDREFTDVAYVAFE